MVSWFFLRFTFSLHCFHLYLNFSFFNLDLPVSCSFYSTLCYERESWMDDIVKSSYAWTSPQWVLPSSSCTASGGSRGCALASRFQLCFSDWSFEFFFFFLLILAKWNTSHDNSYPDMFVKCFSLCLYYFLSFFFFLFILIAGYLSSEGDLFPFVMNTG